MYPEQIPKASRLYLTGIFPLEPHPGAIALPVVFRTAGLLVLSNIFMTFAWYGHLRTLNDRKWYIAALISWGIALFEYLLQVPANRIGTLASHSAS